MTREIISQLRRVRRIARLRLLQERVGSPEQRERIERLIAEMRLHVLAMRSLETEAVLGTMFLTKVSEDSSMFAA